VKKENFMKYVKNARIWIKENKELGEKWVQDHIAEEPSILGLGNLILKEFVAQPIHQR